MQPWHSNCEKGWTPFPFLFFQLYECGKVRQQAEAIGPGTIATPVAKRPPLTL
jgi:hypothetical protein